MQHLNVTRETLYRQVWAEPISKLSATYVVSGSYLARICRELNVPTPGRGYWAQVNAGKNPLIDALPPLKPGDPTMWIRSPTSSRYTDSMPIPPAARSKIPSMKRSKAPRRFLTEAKEIFSKSKKSYSSVYQQPRHGRLVDLLTTLEHLENSITLAEKFFTRLEDYGYQVVIASKDYSYRGCKIETDEIPKIQKNEPYYSSVWRPNQCTVAYLGTVAIGLTIVEVAEEIKGTGYYAYTEKVGSGRYRIYAYSPYQYTDLVKSWQDTKESKLVKQFEEIICEMESMAHQIPDLILEGEKRAEEERQKREADQIEYNRKRELELRAKVETESRADLNTLVDAWASLRNRQAFIEELIQAIGQENSETHDLLMERLKIAKALLGTKSVVDIIKAWKTPEERYADHKYWF